MSARDTIRRTGLAALTALGVLSVQLVLAADPAAALNGYPGVPNAVFGAPGLGNGQLSSPFGVAVAEASGDVYVADVGNKRVERFDAEGNYLAQITGTPEGSLESPRFVAVDNSSSPARGDVYVTQFSRGAIDVFDSTGKYLSQIKGTPTEFFSGGAGGLAVDSSGDLWANEDTSVDEFSDTGSFMGQIDTGRGLDSGSAIDSAGNIYLMFGCGCIGKFSPAGTRLAEWGKREGGGGGLAVNETTNNVFVDRVGSIEMFGAFGEPYGSPVETFGANSIFSSEGIAVNDKTGAVYATQGQADTVAVFKPGLYPDVTTGAASEVQRTSAKLEGVVNPDGEAVTSCQFEYGTSTAYGHTAACVPAPGSGSSPVAVSTDLSGIAPQTTYHYRLTAGNSKGVNAGSDGTFTTPVAVEEVQTEAASNVGKSAGTTIATLNGSLAPDGVETHYYFEYGETEGYGSVSPALPGTDAGKAFELEHAQTQLTGLEVATTYHYRLVATNSFGDTDGADMTFTTPAAVEGVQTGAASEVLSASATLNGSLEPNGVDAHYLFEYGPTEAYGKATAREDAGSATEDRPVSAPVSLPGPPNTTYHYRIVAENVYGTTSGSDQTVTTTAVVPVIGAALPVSHTRAAATVALMLNPENSETTYRLVYGASSGYGQHSESATISGFGEQEVTFGLTGLMPDSTYHYALVASNLAGTVTGPDETFKTSSGAPPTATTGGASNIALTSATVAGTVNPEGLETSYELDFGLDANYGTSIYGEAGASTEDVSIAIGLQNLAPGTTYHYRIVAINSDGKVYGADQTFTTPVYSNPIVLPSTLPLIASPAIAFPIETGTIGKPPAKHGKKAKTKGKKHGKPSAKHGKKAKTKGKKHAKRILSFLDREPASARSWIRGVLPSKSEGFRKGMDS